MMKTAETAEMLIKEYEKEHFNPYQNDEILTVDLIKQVKEKACSVSHNRSDARLYNDNALYFAILYGLEAGYMTALKQAGKEAKA